jgi:hypothetical protein
MKRPQGPLPPPVTGRVVEHQGGDLFLAQHRLDDPGQGQAQDQRPEDLPAHRPCHAQRLANVIQHAHGCLPEA